MTFHHRRDREADRCVCLVLWSSELALPSKSLVNGSVENDQSTHSRLCSNPKNKSTRSTFLPAFFDCFFSSFPESPTSQPVRLRGLINLVLRDFLSSLVARLVMASPLRTMFVRRRGRNGVFGARTRRLRFCCVFGPARRAPDSHLRDP